jgi:hypothetical protein
MSTPQLYRPTAAQQTWIVGGSLLLATVVITVTFQSVPSFFPGASFISIGVFSAALLVFAFGLSGAGSITARRPLGTSALSALAIWTLLAPILSLFFTPADYDQGLTLAWGYIDSVVRFLLALVAVIQIARAGVVPRPWNWAPTWVLAAVAGSWLLQLISVTVLSRDVASISGALMSLDILTNFAGAVFLGVVAIVVASRRSHPRTVEVYSSPDRERN